MRSKAENSPAELLIWEIAVGIRSPTTMRYEVATPKHFTATARSIRKVHLGTEALATCQPSEISMEEGYVHKLQSTRNKIAKDMYIGVQAQAPCIN
jgi:hypothetical protein